MRATKRARPDVSPSADTVDEGARSVTGALQASLGTSACGSAQELLDASNLTAQEVSQAFWHACSAGQRRAADQLLAAGAELNWVSDYAEGSRLDVACNRGTGRDNLIGWLEEQGARSAGR